MEFFQRGGGRNFEFSSIFFPLTCKIKIFSLSTMILPQQKITIIFVYNLPQTIILSTKLGFIINLLNIILTSDGWDYLIFPEKVKSQGYDVIFTE